MRIVILSDCHGDTISLKKIREREKENTGLFIFAGDGIKEFKEIFKDLNYRAVNGNCDIVDGVDEDLINIGNKKILITHGHLYGVKNNLTNLYFRAKEVLADIVIYGHTHIQKSESVDNIKFINPGSASYAYCNKFNSYSVVENTTGEIYHYKV